MKSKETLYVEDDCRDECYSLSRICRMAEYCNIRIHYVPEYSDKAKAKQGIHLLNPSQREIEDAISTAERDGFECIYIHQEF